MMDNGVHLNQAHLHQTSFETDPKTLQQKIKQADDLVHARLEELARNRNEADESIVIQDAAATS